MKFVSQTKNWLYCNLIFNCFTFGILLVSCTCKKLKIQYLPFFDSQSDTYRIIDTAKTNPFPTKTVYYTINQSSLSCINIKELDSVVQSDTEIQKQLKGNYYRVSVILYKDSDNIEEAVKHQSRKLLAESYNDMVAEYIWEEGKLDGAYYYEDGVMLGSEGIILKDLSEEEKN